MRMHRIITAFCICLLLCLPVCAAGNGEGSLTVTLMDQKGTVAGGSLTLYKLEDHADGTAQTLAEFAAESDLPGENRTVGETGTVLFDDLEPGLYLVVQRERAAGYAAVLPFLVRIPMEVDGELLYDVKAYPKVVREQPGKLPQTGQLRWPVPVLAVIGVGLFGFGFHNRKKR